MNDQDKWLDKNTVSCQRFSVRLTPEACSRRAGDDPDGCKGCEQTNGTSDKPPKQCTVEDCGKDHYAKGFCRMHYARRRYAAGGMIRQATVCSIDGCDEPHSARGFCKRHYARNVTHPKQARQRRGLRLTFSGKDVALLERLESAAAANGNSPEVEAKIYIEACLDYYEEQQCSQTNA